MSRSGSSADGVSWQNQLLARAQLKHQIYLFSNLEDSAVRPMMVTPIHSVEEGIEKAIKSLGEDSSLAVIPEGPLVLPILKENVSGD